ncbi:hypothetical protein [Micromonospora sp. SH-82]|uniref:hypothetical protein n=1 Tax=Micromonospora sp. SH-82 TaxID=3132938 RepID=UPI003EBFE891
MPDQQASPAPTGRAGVAAGPALAGRSDRAGSGGPVDQVWPAAREAGRQTAAVADRIRALDRLLEGRDRVGQQVHHRLEYTFALRGPERFAQALHRVLVGARFPDGLTRTCAVAFDPWAARLSVECRLPGPTVIPAARGYRASTPAGPVRPVPRSPVEIRHRYADLVARLAVRTLADAFDAAPPSLVTTVVLNGYGPVRGSVRVDVAETTPEGGFPGTGVHPLLVSAEITRTLWDRTDVDDPGLDPASCLRRLGADVSFGW